MKALQIVTHLKKSIALLVVVLPVLVWLVKRTLPASEDEIRRSACLVDGHSDVCVLSGHDTLVLHSTAIHQQGVWINKHWWWASCDGRVLTVQNDSAYSRFAQFSSDSLRGVIRASIDSLTELADRKDTERDELQYYLRSHGVQDEGYMKIAAYAAQQTKEADSINASLKKLKAFPVAKTLRLIRRGTYRVTWFDAKDTQHSANCRPLITQVGQEGQPVILRTKLRKLPWGAYAVRHLPWPDPGHENMLVCRLVPQDTVAERHTLLVSGSYGEEHVHRLPRLFAVDGSAVFSLHGRFLGVIAGDRVLSNRKEGKR